MLDERTIDSLRERVRASMSDFRFNHTAEVEKMAVRIGELYAPESISLLRAAALLHDITKEKSTDEHLEILRENGVEITPLDILSPKTLHARTAEYVLLRDFPELATEEVCRAVRLHTVGAPDMSVVDMIIYLADYIDMSRKFDDCVRLREYFWNAEPEKLGADERTAHLYRTLVLSFDMTIKALVEEGSPISTASVNTRNELLRRLECKL